MIDEERLSRLLRDPGWSLPPWPPGQAMARIRRAARRQRLLAVCRAAAVAVIAGAVALAAVSHVARGATRPAASTPAITGPRPDHAQVLPQVGSSGFPATVYPAPVAVPVPGRPATVACPAPAGLQVARHATAAAVLARLRSMGAGLSSELLVADRTIWPALADSRRRAALVRTLRAAPSSVRYSGPLRAGVGELASVRRAVATECGDPVVRATWVIVSGLPGSRSPSRDAELLFLNRRGHVLLYAIQ
jgi:hypothetical protein